jgi:type II secretory pathway component PulF
LVVAIESTMNAHTIFPPMLADAPIPPTLIVFWLLVALMKFFATIISFFLVAGVVGGVIFLIHFFFTLPMRRAERARLFLDLLESALKRGQSVEAMILSIAQSRDRTLGVRFHLLAAHIESGLRLVAALEKVPRLLPLQIAAMLRVGEKLGDLRRGLPACREILRDRPAAVRSAMHYMILVVLLFSPVFIFVVVMTAVMVIPKFKEVAAGMNVTLWPLTTFVFALIDSGWLIGFEIIISLLLIAAVLVYIGGPGFVRWFQFRGLPFVDWIAWRIPWKQKRLQRTFSAMLAVLLDGGVPEAEAVRLAGDCTANEICRHRTRLVMAALEQGTKLDDAIRAFDDSGEFRWRLTNATHARGGFLSALHGWHEALDAKAFQQEEATAHAITSGLVILNGVLVALIATGMFGILIACINAALLW